MVPEAHVPTTRWTAATVYPDMWVDPDDDPRETDAEPVGERFTLIEFLRCYKRESMHIAGAVTQTPVTGVVS
jgi:hypothetical protein